MRTSNQFLNYTIVRTTSEDPLYPATNMKDLRSSTLSFRTLNTLDTEVVINFGSQLAAITPFLYNVNFSSAKWQGNSSDSWGSPPFDSGLFTIEEDPELFLYKTRNLLSAFNHQWLRLFIPSQATTNGASHFEIGILGIPQSMESFQSSQDDHFEFPLEMEKEIIESASDLAGGGDHRTLLNKIPSLSLGLSGRMSNINSVRKKFNKIFAKPDAPVVYMDMETANSWEFYILKRNTNISFPRITPTLRRMAVGLKTIV